MATFDRYKDQPEVNAVRPRFGTMTVAIAAAFVVAATLNGTQTLAQDATFKDFPYLIYCQYKGIDHAYYFSQLDPDGRAIYITPDRQAGTITLHGVAQRVGGDQAGTCSNKTLDDLRAYYLNSQDR